MTLEQQAILQLLRKALNPSAVLSVPSGVNWKRFIRLAHEQGVLGVCFSAVEQTPSGSPSMGSGPGFEELMDWIGRVELQKKVYEKQRKAIAELAAFYSEHCIRMMLLKGYGLSLNYPTPELRPGGDIDIYLGGKWKEADSLVRDLLGIKVEEGHEHHTTFLYGGIMVENHYDFINVKAHKDAQLIENKLKELAANGSQEFSMSSGSILLPSADFNVIFLIRHLGQHFAGERITLRQLLDWGLFLQKEAENVHWENIVPFLKDMGIWTFFNQINAICEDYLGISLPSSIPHIERQKQLEKRIFDDVLQPEFYQEKPKKLFPILIFKAKRWWYNRWKHPLVYKEWLLPMFFTLLWSHLKRIDTIKD